MDTENESNQANRTISTVSYMRLPHYTPGLSTWWSTTVLKGILVLRWVFPLRLLSAVIPSVHSYAALPLARQLLHQSTFIPVLSY